MQKKKLSMGDYSPAHDPMRDVKNQLDRRKNLKRRARILAWLNAIMATAPFAALLLIFTFG